MSSKRHLRRRSCEGKRRHPDKNAANRAAYGTGRHNAATRMAPGDMHAYHCPHCGFWHVGHVPGSGVSKPRAMRWMGHDHHR